MYKSFLKIIDERHSLIVKFQLFPNYFVCESHIMLDSNRKPVDWHDTAWNIKVGKLSEHPIGKGIWMWLINDLGLNIYDYLVSAGLIDKSAEVTYETPIRQSITDLFA